MRLQEMYYICKTCLANWAELESSARAVQDQHFYRVSNAQKVRASLSVIDSIQVFQYHFHRLYQLYPELKLGENNSVEFPQKEWNAIKLEHSEIKKQVETIVSMCEFLHVPQYDSGFDIKMPPDISIDGMADCLKDVHRIFSNCPTLCVPDAEIKLQAVDIGSIWIVIGIVASAATAKILLSAVAELVDKAIIIRSHILTTKQQEEFLRQSRLAGELLETMVGAHKKMLDEMVDVAASGIAESHGIGENCGEDRERIRTSIHSLAEWMSKGMEIYSSIGAPDEIKATFPPVESQQLSISDTTKLLTEMSGTFK